jgi:hypothetical protein
MANAVTPGADLPSEAADVVKKVQQQIAKVEENVHGEITEIQEKADAEIAQATADGQKKIQAHIKKAVATLQPLLSSYCKEEKLDEALAIRAQIKQLQAYQLQPAAMEAQPNPGDLSGFASQIDKTIYFEVTGDTSGSLWGTDVYTTDSSLAAAAVHAGKVQPEETKVVKVTIVSPPPSFEGSTRHDVTSESYGSYPGAFRFT